MRLINVNTAVRVTRVTNMLNRQACLLLVVMNGGEVVGVVLRHSVDDLFVDCTQSAGREVNFSFRQYCR